MEVLKDEFLPDPEMSRKEMEDKQREIAREASFNGTIEKETDELKIAGIDQAFTEDEVVSAVVVRAGGGRVEKSVAREKLEMPYIPGLLAFREAPAIISALQKLETEPDLLLLDGSGRIHYREAGIATHIGVMFEKPAIGVAKNLLCGETENDVEKLEQGEKVGVYSDPQVKTLPEQTLIGYAYQSQQYPDSYRINPLYICPGNLVSAEESVRIVEELCKGYKLPEPLRLADKFVGQVK